MNTRIFRLAVSLSLSFGGAALSHQARGAEASQAAAYSVPSSAAGHWLHDAQGNTIGSVRSLSADGRTAVIMIGSYFQQGSHQEQVSSSDLSIVNGKVTLQPAMAQALNTTTRQ